MLHDNNDYNIYCSTLIYDHEKCENKSIMNLMQKICRSGYWNIYFHFK